MRISSGNFKRKKILEPKDQITRPLKDLTKESIFNIIYHSKKFDIQLKDSNILDLERSISDKIGLNVLIKNNKRNKGTITFSYKEIDQLNKIIEIIKANY